MGGPHTRPRPRQRHVPSMRTAPGAGTRRDGGRPPALVRLFQMRSYVNEYLYSPCILVNLSGFYLPLRPASDDRQSLTHTSLTTCYEAITHSEEADILVGGDSSRA